MDKKVMLLLLLVLLLAVLYGSTESARYGDAPVYANEILLSQVIEPGHLLWRPFATVIAHAVGLMGSRSQVLWVLEALSLVCALLTAVMLYIVAHRFLSAATSLFVAALASLANGFWSYAFSGCSYSLSVLLLTLALYVALRVANRDEQRAWGVFLVGVCGGLAALAWAIQLIAGPALLALVLRSGRPARGAPEIIARSGWLGAGYALSFATPSLMLYALSGSISSGAYVPPGPSGMTFVGWLASADHGVDAHSDLAQLLRAAIGWAQSFVSIGDLGQDLRLWLYKEMPFPLSASLATLAAFYVAMAAAILMLARHFAKFDAMQRAVVVAAVVATVTNLLFGFLWQGTDLERYFPSLPFQALAFGLVVERWRARAPRTALPAAAAILMLTSTVTWITGFHDVLRPNSPRQVWNHALASQCLGTDVVIVLGNRKFGLGEPHNPNFPTVLNVSMLVVTQGDRWRIPIVQALATARRRNGRVLLGDSVLRTDPAPRDGWSFTQHPHPSATEISNYFRTLRPSQPAFAVDGERLWLAQAP